MEESSLTVGMGTNTYAYDEPCLSIRLEYMAGEGEGQDTLAEQAIAAIDVVTAGWLAPLAWEMYVGCLDTELMHAAVACELPQPYWLLCRERVPPGIDVDPVYDKHMVATETELSPDRLRPWITQALAQTCGHAPRFVPYWDSFHTLAMRARLPEAVSSPRQETLRMECYAGTIIMPIDRIDGQGWVSGPPEQHFIGPPLKLTASNMHGMYINLDLAIYWDLWTRDPAGRAQVEAAVERVLALGRGWQRAEG